MKAHLRYLSYVARHKWWVLVAGLRTGVPLWQLLVHDWTKLLPSEWTPYVDHFYRDHSEETLLAQANYGTAEMAPFGALSEDRFNVAWNLHQKRNRHHWQFWLITMDSGESWSLPMPERFIREMVADWAGAGRAITGRWDVADWYAKNRSRMKLRNETRNRVEALLAQHFGLANKARRAA